MNRIRRTIARLFHPTPTVPGRRSAAPLWVRGLTAGGRPIVLGVALLMCAPGEYHLAYNAGWHDPFTYGMPVVLSAYAGIAAAVASTRQKGDRGRWSAIIGACLALGLAMAAQVVSHLIGTGHVIANQPFLIAVTSLVPPAVVGHLLHLAATPPDAVASSTAGGSQALPEPPTVTVERVADDQPKALPEAPKLVIPDTVRMAWKSPVGPEVKPFDLDHQMTSKVTTAVPADASRQVVTEVVTLTPSELYRRAAKLNRELVTSTNRPVTIDRLRDEFGLTRRDATELRRQVVTPKPEERS